jgi:hypothetical protein
MVEVFLIVAVTDLKQKVRTVREYRIDLTGAPRVPQIWLTYDELAALMDCDRAGARATAVAMRLDRRKSRDGQTRAKLTPSLCEVFLDGVLRQRLEQELVACADDLRAMHERMAARPAVAAPEFRSTAAG